MKNPFPKDEGDSVPDYDDKVFHQDWKDEPEPQPTALDKIKADLAKKIPAVTGLPAPVVNQPSKEVREEKKSMADYKKAWKARNRDHYLAKNREYVTRSRAKKKS